MESLSMEIYKPIKIKGFEHYHISNYGNIKNSNTNIIRRLKDNGNGYLSCTLKSKGICKTVYPHRELARSFFDNFNPNLHVNHKDYNRKNNHISNLELLTPKENVQYSIENLLTSRLKSQGKTCYVYKDGVLIDQFFGVNKGCKERGWYLSEVLRVCRGERKSYKGFTFEVK